MAAFSRWPRICRTLRRNCTAGRLERTATRVGISNWCTQRRRRRGWGPAITADGRQGRAEAIDAQLARPRPNLQGADRQGNALRDHALDELREQRVQLGPGASRRVPGFPRGWGGRPLRPLSLATCRWRRARSRRSGEAGRQPLADELGADLPHGRSALKCIAWHLHVCRTGRSRSARACSRRCAGSARWRRQVVGVPGPAHETSSSAVVGGAVKTRGRQARPTAVLCGDAGDTVDDHPLGGSWQNTATFH